MAFHHSALCRCEFIGNNISTAPLLLADNRGSGAWESTYGIFFSDRCGFRCPVL